MSGEADVCWQCSEFVVCFAEVLNTIETLTSHGITATEEKIVNKIVNANNGLEHEIIRQIPNLLEYACNVSYVSNFILNNTSSYKLNKHLEFSTTCALCGEILEPFAATDFVVGVSFVDRATFEELATNLNDFKKHVNDSIFKLNNKVKCPELELDRSVLANKLLEMEKRNKKLEEALIDKEILIDHLIKKLSRNSTNVLKRDKSSETDLVSEFHQQNNLKNAKDDFIAFKNPSKRKPVQLRKDIQLSNRFNDLYINDYNGYVYDDNVNMDNEVTNCDLNNGKELMDSTKFSNGFRRPNNVINNYPERDVLFNQKRKKVVPGASSYSNIAKQGKSVCIISDSITRRINMKQFNHHVKNATVYRKVFPGGTVEEIEHYAIKILENKNIDAVILNVGSNNIINNYSTVKSDVDITSNIMRIVDMCYEAGVSDVFVSGITCLPINQTKVDNINELLKINAKQFGYVFIDNGNIFIDKHLWKDNIHLNNDGLTILANNFIDTLNEVLYKH